MLKIKVDKVLGDAREDDSAMNERGNGMQYAVGAEVAIPGDMRHYLRCTTAGTTGATAPEVPADFQSGVTTIQDGTVVWTVYGYMIGNDAAPYVYGIDYDTTIATASSACKKIVLAADGTYTQVDDFMQLPAHNFRRCVMSNLANRTIAYYLHPDDSSRKLDGTAADLTGGDGDVMVEIPITYWRIDHYTDANNHAHTVWLVSNQAFTNSAPHPFFYVSPGGATLRTQYVGAFHSVICDSDGAPLTTSLEASASAAYVAGRKARSVIGAKPFTSMTQATHRTAAGNNGGYGINSLFKQFLLLMMAIEGGSFDTQATISEGFLFAKEWDYRYTRLSGRTVGMGNSTGSVFYDATAGDGNVAFFSFKIGSTTYYRYQDGDADGPTDTVFAWRSWNTLVYTESETPSNGSHAATEPQLINDAGEISSYSSTPAEQRVVAFSYRGIENPYGEIWEFEDGVVADTAHGYLYHTPDVTLYSDSTYLTTYLRDVHAWPQTGWVKTFDERTFFAKSIGGSATTYLCDYFYFASDSARVVVRGGNVASGPIGGAGYVYAFSGLAGANAYFGARLAA